MHADDANLLNFDSCVKSINKPVYYHLKNLSNCLKANNIPLKVDKTKLVFLLLLKNN